MNLKSLLTLFFLFWGFFIIAQNDKSIEKSCLVIQYISKDADSSALADKISTNYHPQGFILSENCVYDFIIDDNTYLYSILHKIENDKFSIIRDWDCEINSNTKPDTLQFSINQKIDLRVLIIENGIGGLPKKIKSKKYKTSIIQSQKYCEIENTEVFKKDITYKGHFYFTGYGLKKIIIVDGRPYLYEGSVLSSLRL
jgi:hypothetical protein